MGDRWRPDTTEQWLRDTEKRLDILERRAAPPPSVALLTFALDAPRTVDTFPAPYLGQVRLVVNTLESHAPLTLHLPGSADRTLDPGEAIVLIYTGQWQQITLA